jgi:hypothetical protein
VKFDAESNIEHKYCVWNTVCVSIFTNLAMVRKLSGYNGKI